MTIPLFISLTFEITNQLATLLLIMARSFTCATHN